MATHVVLPELAGETRVVDAGFGTLQGLYWLCANLATRRPLLLVVDDAQWADESWATLTGDTPAERLLLAQLGIAQMNAGGPAKAAAEFAERAARGPGL